jgi:hypothetical protein
LRCLHNHDKYYETFLAERLGAMNNLESATHFIQRNKYFCNLVIYYNNLFLEANLLYFWIGICLAFQYSGSILIAE